MCPTRFWGNMNSLPQFFFFSSKGGPQITNCNNEKFGQLYYSMLYLGSPNSAVLCLKADQRLTYKDLKHVYFTFVYFLCCLIDSLLFAKIHMQISRCTFMFSLSQAKFLKMPRPISERLRGFFYSFCLSLS